jgi:hypothetical protein
MTVLPFAVTVEPEILRRHALRIKTALRYADISPSKAAVWMNLDPSQFARQLEGEGHLSYTRLVKLPASFWSWLAVLIAEDVGLPLVIRRAARLQIALLRTRKKMARISEPVSDEEKAS